MKIEKMELRLYSCPNCKDKIDILSKSVIDKKSLIKDFLTKYSKHLEFCKKSERKPLRLNLSISIKSGQITTFEPLKLIV
jgi:hypothetical protein